MGRSLFKSFLTGHGDESASVSREAAGGVLEG